MSSQMREWVNQYSDEFVMGDDSNGLTVMDGYDDCIIGIATRFGHGGYETFVVYDRRRVLRRLMAEGMSEEEAQEFHGFNQEAAFVGPHTPAFLDTPEPVSDIEDDTMPGEM
jgi:hypothetical protein